MVQLSILFATLTAAMVAKTWAFVPTEERCGCFNMVQVGKPSSISECYPRLKFSNQIYVNYNSVLNALRTNGARLRCDFSQYITNVHAMRDLTLQIVEAYFSCAAANCTADVMAAYGNFVDFRTNTFNPYTTCSMANLSPACAQVIQQAQSPVFGSAENIMVGMVTCANLKVQEPNTGAVQVSVAVSLTQLLPSNSFIGCNCIRIDPRPIPTSQSECFSADYIASVTNFINVNFGRIFSKYSTKQDSCGYSLLLMYIRRFMDLALQGTTLLASTGPTLAQVNTINTKYNDLLVQYNLATRTFILQSDESCYVNLSSRTSPLTITDAVIGIITKCIQYVDVKNKRC